MRLFLIGIFLLLVNKSFSQKNYKIDTLNLKINSSFRGLSVVNDSIIWLSGSNGYVARSTNGGKTFDTLQLNSYSKLDFRDIEAFDEKTAVIVNVGSPAYVLRTIDGGKEWTRVYLNLHKEIFFDGMDFWDSKKGIAFSDPINGKLFIITTNNAGKTWKEIPFKDCPQMQEGEAGFAASGTAIRTIGEGNVWIGTGGKAAHVFYSSDYGDTWKKFSCPIIKGKETTGIFSLAFKDERTGIAVGGDYTMDTLRLQNCFLTFSGGTTWQAPFTSPLGYRSCVEFISSTSLVTTGTSGTDVSVNGGRNWKNISRISFNVIRKAKKGNRIFLAGENGRIGIME